MKYLKGECFMINLNVTESQIAEEAAVALNDLFVGECHAEGNKIFLYLDGGHFVLTVSGC